MMGNVHLIKKWKLPENIEQKYLGRHWFGLVPKFSGPNVSLHSPCRPSPSISKTRETKARRHDRSIPRGGKAVSLGPGHQRRCRRRRRPRPRRAAASGLRRRRTPPRRSFPTRGGGSAAAWTTPTTSSTGALPASLSPRLSCSLLSIRRGPWARLLVRIGATKGGFSFVTAPPFAVNFGLCPLNLVLGEFRAIVWLIPLYTFHDLGRAFNVIGGGSDMKEIVTLLKHIKDKAHKDGQKKTEQAISRWWHFLFPCTHPAFWLLLNDYVRDCSVTVHNVCALATVMFAPIEGNLVWFGSWQAAHLVEICRILHKTSDCLLM